MKVCLFIASDDIIKNSNIYKEIILKNIKEFGSFTIINFNNILKKNKNLVNDKINISILKSKFGKKIDYFNPSSKIEFLQYIRADKIFAIDSLGKTFDFFSIRKLINKKNIKLVLIMNLGFLSNELFYSINSFKGYLFKFKKTINNLLYKFLVIIKFFPNIFIYFETRKEIYENCIKNKKKMLSLFFPFLNIYYFENIYRINSRSYENYLKSKNILDEEKIIFLDGNYKHPDITNRENLNIIELKKDYFKRLEFFFNWIENLFNKKVEICLHPSSDLNEYKSFFKNRVTVNLTNENIIKSFIVIFHESSAILDAIMYKKKIISLNTNLFGKYISDRIFYYKKELDLFSIELDNYENFKNYQLKDVLGGLRYPIKNYDTFINRYMKCDDDELGTDKIIRIFKTYESKHYS
jgi:hypothetical protein